MHHCRFVVRLSGLAVFQLAAFGGDANAQEGLADQSVPAQNALSPQDALPPQDSDVRTLDLPHLSNCVQVHSNVISGGVPEGEPGFAELRKIGIRTIISVDGAKPDVASATKYGLKYVHLPHGYDGVPKQRALELARAVRDLPGPVYIHCHHGRHRSPAAAAVACVGAGLITPRDASVVLHVARTSPAYRGLFQSVSSAAPFTSSELNSVSAEFPAVAQLPAMAEAMVQIEEVFDHLKHIQHAGWRTPDDTPGLVPDHEALMLREHFTELARSKEAHGRSERFRQLLAEATETTQQLEDTLQTEFGPQETTRLLDLIETNCRACHQEFRDVPLSEKR